MKRFWQFLILAIPVACQPMTAIPTPTTTAIPAVNNTSTVVPISETPSRYELRQPQPEDLLKMIDAVLLTEEQLTHVDEISYSILEDEFGYLHTLLGNDFERYYLNGFLDADKLITQTELPWEQHSWSSLNSFSPVLQISLLKYINNHPAVLESNDFFELPNSNIRTFSMDLDRDGKLEWLVGAEHYKYSLQNWLLLIKQEDNLYHLLPSFGHDWTVFQSSPVVIEVRDLTGDGNPEIIHVKYQIFSGRETGTIKVYTWKAGRLSHLESIPLPGSPPIYHGVSGYVIDDFNGDGVAEIRVHSPKFRRFGCEWIESSIYYLDGRESGVEVIGKEIPQTDDCLIARALENENPAEQIRLYRNSLEKFDSEVSPLDKLAWIKLQLAMANVANGDDDEAYLQIQELINLEGEGNFLNFIKDKYAETNFPSPLMFCDELYTSIAIQLYPERFDSEIDLDLTNYGYPVQVFPVPEMICPFPDVIRKRLSNLRVSPSVSPVDALSGEEFSYSWTQSQNWDDDSAQEWLGILQFRQPILTVMNGEGNGEIRTIEINALEVELSSIETAIYKSENDSGARILLLLTVMGKYCNSPNVEKQFLSIDINTLEYDKDYICDSRQYSLKSEEDIEIALKEFSKPYIYEIKDSPAWYYLPEISELTFGQKTILEPIRTIGSGIHNRVDTNKIESGLSALIESLPKEDPAARLLINRLYYLRGLNYELAGQDEEAVAAYLELIEFSPESLWSQYARIRIEPTQP